MEQTSSQIAMVAATVRPRRARCPRPRGASLPCIGIPASGPAIVLHPYMLFQEALSFWQRMYLPPFDVEPSEKIHVIVKSFLFSALTWPVT